MRVAWHVVLFVLLEYSRIVFLLIRNHVIHDSGELVGSGRLRSSHSSFHSAKIVAKEALAVVQTLGAQVADVLHSNSQWRERSDLVIPRKIG